MVERAPTSKAKGSSGWTALDRAPMGGHKAVVRLLVEKGGDVEVMLVLLEEGDHIGSYFSSASYRGGSWDFGSMIMKSGENFRVVIELGFVGSLPEVS